MKLMCNFKMNSGNLIFIENKKKRFRWAAAVDLQLPN